MIGYEKEIQDHTKFILNLGRTKIRSILILVPGTVLEEYLPVLEKYEYSCVRSTGDTHLVLRVGYIPVPNTGVYQKAVLDTARY